MGKKYFTLTISTGYLSLVMIFTTVFFAGVSSFNNNSQFNQVNQVIVLDRNFGREEQCSDEILPLLTLSLQRSEIQSVSLPQVSSLPPLRVNSAVNDRAESPFTLFLVDSSPVWLSRWAAAIYYPWLDNYTARETGGDHVANFADSPGGPAIRGLDDMPVQQDSQQSHLAVILQSREG